MTAQSKAGFATRAAVWFFSKIKVNCGFATRVAVWFFSTVKVNRGFATRAAVSVSLG